MSPVVPRRFYEKVQALHQDPEASVDNPLLAFSLIKRLHSDWPNVIYSDEATSNTQGTGDTPGFVPPLSPGQSQEVVGRGWSNRRIDGRAERVEEQGSRWKGKVNGYRSGRMDGGARK